MVHSCSQSVTHFLFIPNVCQPLTFINQYAPTTIFSCALLVGHRVFVPKMARTLSSHTRHLSISLYWYARLVSRCLFMSNIGRLQSFRTKNGSYTVFLYPILVRDSLYIHNTRQKRVFHTHDITRYRSTFLSSRKQFWSPTFHLYPKSLDHCLFLAVSVDRGHFTSDYHWPRILHQNNHL